MPESLPLLLQPAPGFLGRPQPHDTWVAGELARPLVAVPDPGPHRPREQRLPAPEAAAPALAVAAPELDVGADPVDSAPPEASQGQPQRGGPPDDPVGGCEDEDAQLALAGA